MECLESKILKTKMFKLGCVNIKAKNWNLYMKHLEFNHLKTWMSKFGCVNTESWKLKTEIWNLFVKCLEGIWNFEN